MTEFIPVSDKLPRDGQRIDWITPTGAQVNGCHYHRGMWWLQPSLYAYYTPLSWRPAAEKHDD